MTEKSERCDFIKAMTKMLNHDRYFELIPQCIGAYEGIYAPRLRF